MGGVFFQFCVLLARSNFCAVVNITQRALKDIKTWFYASRAILRYCDSENYYVIVPAKDYETFRLLSPVPYKVIDESDLTSNFSLSSVRDFLPDDRKNTAGWYYQQFLKVI